MSLHAMNAVWRNSLAKPADKLVLIAMADIGDDHGGVFPRRDNTGRIVPGKSTTYKDLAAKCNMSEKSVQRAVTRLIELGELSITLASTQGRPQEYQIHLDELDPIDTTMPLPLERDGRRGKQKKGAVDEDPAAAKVDESSGGQIDHLIENSDLEPIAPPGGNPECPAQVDNIDHLSRSRGVQHKKKTNKPYTIGKSPDPPSKRPDPNELAQKILMWVHIKRWSVPESPPPDVPDFRPDAQLFEAMQVAAGWLEALGRGEAVARATVPIGMSAKGIAKHLAGPAHPDGGDVHARRRVVLEHAATRRAA